MVLTIIEYYSWTNLKMEAVISSETLINNYQRTWHIAPEDSSVQ